MALQTLDTILQQGGMSCQSLGLPNVDQEVRLHQEFDQDQELQNAEAQIQHLNQQQLLLVNTVLQALDSVQNGHSQEAHAYFVDGPGGSGKTTVYNTLIACCRGRGAHVAASAWTGIAATLLAGG